MFRFIRTFRTSCKRLGRERNGSVAPVFALALLPALFAIGGAVDYSSAAGARSKLQETLDSALIAGASETDASLKTATAQKWLSAAWNEAYPLQNVSFTQASDGGLEGAASVAVPASFMKIAGVDSLTVSATAKAMAPGNTMGPCLHALKTAVTGLTMSSSSAIDAPGCGLQVNSTVAKAVSMSGSSWITTKSNCIVGTLSSSSSGAVTPSPTIPCASVPDPFASMTKPTVGACNYTNFKVSSPATLQPGVYCGGLTVSSSAVTFNPGTYIIKDGALVGSGGASFTGKGVSFYLTGANAGVTISGGGNIHLVASSAGPIAGFVFFLDSSSAFATKSVLSGTSELYYEGILYFPGQKLEMSGGSTTFTQSPFTAYIAGDFLLSGASAVRIKADPKGTSVKLPADYAGSGVVRLAR